MVRTTDHGSRLLVELHLPAKNQCKRFAVKETYSLKEAAQKIGRT
jgi:hypothetical protein